MFAKKYTANDEHHCDSLAEKIIDDWLYARKIEHKRKIHYPDNKALTVDFVLNCCTMDTKKRRIPQQNILLLMQ